MKNYTLSTAAQKSLAELGKNISHSRILRCLTQQRLCKQAGIARSTLQEIEKGSAKVSMGNYIKVLESMGMEGHLSRIAVHDKVWLARLAEELGGRKRVR